MAISTYRTKKGELRHKVIIWKNGRVVTTRSFRRKVDAKHWEKLKTSEVELDGVHVKASNIKLDEFFHEVYWPQTKVRLGTAQGYRSIFNMHIAPVFGRQKMITITAGDWSAHFQRLVAKGMSPARVNRVQSVASAIYSFAVRTGYAKVHPVASLGYYQEGLKDFKYWTLDEAQRFLAWAEMNAPDRFPLYQMAYETGLRVSELSALQWDCVDLSRRLVNILRRFCLKTNAIEDTTKSGRKRIVGMNQGLCEVLRGLKQKSCSRFVFSHEDGRMMRYEHIRKHFMRDQKAAGVTKINVHDIRHTFASHFMMKGGSIYDLKELLGHADVRTTERYAHLATDHLVRQASLVSYSSPVGDNVIPHKPHTNSQTF